MTSLIDQLEASAKGDIETGCSTTELWSEDILKLTAAYRVLREALEFYTQSETTYKAFQALAQADALTRGEEK